MTASTSAVDISRQHLLDLPTPPVASITQVKHLSSYSWIEASTPTIAVPGSPPLWSPLRTPRQLKKDSGLIYIAQNAARHPDSPLEPLFRALYITNPSFDIRSIDVVTDRNNLRKLLSFVNPASTRDFLQTFTINIEVVKDTVIFSRVETATHEFIKLHQFRGCGHEFKRVYTKTKISGSTGHHRILSYRFGDLNFIIRHEADAYVDAGTEAPNAGMLGSLSLSPTSSLSNTTPTGSKLKIEKKGQVIPLGSSLEIKTRVYNRPLRIHEIAPQLWISQTLKLVRAYYKNSSFQNPKVKDVAAQIRKWEEYNQMDLRKLAALVSKIVSVVKGFGGNATVIYNVKKDKLVVERSDGKRFLPKDLYSKWDESDKSEAGPMRHMTQVLRAP